MKIAFVLINLSKTGSMVVSHNIARGISGKHETHVYTFDLAQSESTWQGIIYHEIPISGRFREIKSFNFLLKNFRHERFNYVFTVFNLYEPVVFFAAKIAALLGRFRVSCAFTIHSSSKFLSQVSPIKRIPVYLIYLLSVHLFDDLIAVSNGVMTDWKHHFLINRKMYLLYNPIDLDQVRQGAKGEPEFSFIPGKSYIVTVGRLVKGKNIPMLLKSFRILSNKRDDVFLLIIGDGNEREPLEKIVHEYGLDGCVSFTGHVINTYAILKHASLFVLTSDFEALPTVLVEALCLGRKIISTDCPYGPSEILSDGKYGRLVPMNDVDALFRAMDQSLNEEPVDSSDLVERAQDFSFGSAIPAYLRFLEERAPRSNSSSG